MKNNAQLTSNNSTSMLCSTSHLLPPYPPLPTPHITPIINLKELIKYKVKCSIEIWDAVLLVAGIVSTTPPSHDSNKDKDSVPYEYARNTSRVGDDFQILDFPNPNQLPLQPGAGSSGLHLDISRTPNQCEKNEGDLDSREHNQKLLDSAGHSFKPSTLLQRLKFSLYLSDLKNVVECLKSSPMEDISSNSPISENVPVILQESCVANNSRTSQEYYEFEELLDASKGNKDDHPGIDNAMNNIPSNKCEDIPLSKNILMSNWLPPSVVTADSPLGEVYKSNSASLTLLLTDFYPEPLDSSNDLRDSLDPLTADPLIDTDSNSQLYPDSRIYLSSQVYPDTDLTNVNTDINTTIKNNPTINLDMIDGAAANLNPNHNLDPNLNLHFEEAGEGVDEICDPIEYKDNNPHFSQQNNSIVDGAISNERAGIKFEEEICLYLKNVTILGKEFIQKDMLIEAPVIFDIDLISFYTPASIDTRQMTYLRSLATDSSIYPSTISTSSSSFSSAKEHSCEESSSTSSLPISTSSLPISTSSLPIATFILPFSSSSSISTKEPSPMNGPSASTHGLGANTHGLSPSTQGLGTSAPRESSKEPFPSISLKSQQKSYPYKTLCTITRTNLSDLDIITALKKYHNTFNKSNTEEFNFVLNILNIIEKELIHASSKSNESSTQLELVRQEKRLDAHPQSILSTMKIVWGYISRHKWIEVYDHSGWFINICIS